MMRAQAWRAIVNKLTQM